VGTVTSGTSPAVTNSGTTSAAVFDFTLQKGDKGDKGDTGEQGPQGEPGTVTAVAGSAVSTFNGTGSATTFAPLNGYNGTDVGAYLVSIGGIDQRPTTDWTISSANSGTITFASAPPNGAAIVVRAFIGTGTTNGNATLLQGRALADTAPTNGQAVVWDSANSTWKPGTVSGGGGSDIGGRAWDSAAAYVQGDLVATSQRETWICIQDGTNHDPTEAESAWWAPLPADAVSLQLRPVATTAPTDGQSIVWDDANSTWKPGNASVLGVSVSGAVSGSSNASIAIGQSSSSGTGLLSLNNIAIGEQAYAGTSDGSSFDIAIGPYAQAEAIESIAIGHRASAYACGISIGKFSQTLSNSIAIGPSSSANFIAAIAIGSSVHATENGQVLIGPHDLGVMKSKINEIITWANTNGASITPL
jgi:hypothetical protein